MRKLVYIVIILFLSLSNNDLYGQKTKKQKKSTNTTKVDNNGEIRSAKGFPYIEKFHKGIREKIAGNYTEAKLLFHQCLEIRKDNDAVYFALAEIAKKENNSTEAVQYFLKAKELDPDNIVYTQELAFQYFEKFDFRRSEELFKELVSKQPRDIDFRYGYVKVLIYNRKYKDAIQQIDKMQEQIGISPELSNMKADLYLEQRDYKRAEETILELKDEYPDDMDVLRLVIGFYDQQGEKEKAYKMVEELAKKDKDNGIAQFVIAHNYYEIGKKEQFLEIAPSIFDKEDVNLKQKLMLFGMLTEYAEDTTIYRVSKLLYDAYPNDFNVAMEYGISLEAQRKSKAALAVFRENLNNETDFTNWFRVLEFEKNHKAYQELYEDGNSAVILFPSVPDVYYYAALGALKTNKTDEAIELIAAGEMFVLDDWQIKADFLSLKGQIAFHQKDYKKGIVAFEKAISNQKYPAVRVVYAIALAEANITLDIAGDLISKIAKTDQNAEFYFAKALLFKQKGQLQKGIDILLEGIENYQLYDADLYDYLGDLYFENNQKEKAVEAWTEAENRESGNKVLPKKIKEVKYYAPKYF